MKRGLHKPFTVPRALGGIKASVTPLGIPVKQ